MNVSHSIIDVDERSLIHTLSTIFGAINDTDVMVGAGDDDCAIIAISDQDCLVVTTDMLHRKTDFPQQMSAWQIGWMSAAVNLSDIASMGARPVGLLAAIGFTTDMEVQDAVDIARGMSDCAIACSTSVIGGDTDLHDELTITGTALGRVRTDSVLRRNGARPGDLVCVTGNTGSAGAALLVLENDLDGSDVLLRSLLEPMPRIHEGQQLAATGAVTSAIDTSDGLAMSLYDLAAASDVGFRIYEERLPIVDEVRGIADNQDELLELALYTGGDFELLFTVSPGRLEQVRETCDLTVLGDVVGMDEGIAVVGTDGNTFTINRKGYLHIGSLEEV
ncbi:MAG: thiamine-phosphate kinase [Methanosarcinaceae archaeon]